MASTVATYSRQKKQQVASYRVSPMAVRASLAASHRVPMIPALYHRAQHGLAGLLPVKHNDSVSEIASALLDTTIGEYSVAIQTSPETSPRPDSRGYTSSEYHRHARRLSDPATKHADSNDQLAPARLLTRSNTTRDGLSTAGSAKLPNARTIHLESLAKLEGATASAMPNLGHDAAGINQKVEAMLAATANLKSNQPIRAKHEKPGSSILTRLNPNRVLGKVGLAVTQKFHDKWHAKASKSPDTIDDLCPLPFDARVLSPIDMSDKPSPISAIEIRLNEGGNLNKSKVQKMTGGHIARKPLPNQGSSLKLLGAEDDPFKDHQRSSPSPNEFERYLRRSVSDVESARLPLLALDPFESENLMNNQSSPMLSFRPSAHSTPRRRMGLALATADDDSDLQTWFDEIPPETPLTGLTMDSPARSESPLQGHGSSGVSSTADPLLYSLPSLAGSPASSCHSLLSKKHPAPTPTQLESLQNELECASMDKEAGTRGQVASQALKHGRGLRKVKVRQSPRRRAPAYRKQHREALASKQANAPTTAQAATSSHPYMHSDYKGSYHSTKKHPSPSRAQLLLLAHTFELVLKANLIIAATTDELAGSFTEMVEAAAQQAQQQRGLRGDGNRPRRGTFPGARFVPGGSMEVDELQ